MEKECLNFINITLKHPSIKEFLQQYVLIPIAIEIDYYKEPQISSGFAARQFVAKF